MKIKKVLPMLAVVLAVLAMPSTGKTMPSDDMAYLYVDAYVEATYQIDLSDYNLYLGSVYPGGTTGIGTNSVYCYTNGENSWSLNIQADSAATDDGVTLQYKTGSNSFADIPEYQTEITNGSGNDTVAVDYQAVADSGAVSGYRSWWVVYTISEYID